MKPRTGWGRLADVRVGIGVLVLAIAVAFAATRFSFLQGSGSLGGAGSRPAPAFSGIDAWLNSRPLTLEDLRGHVVWIDFWTYSCINCIRTLPFVRKMYARYHTFGLDVVGVHSPEFTFEKDRRNVAAALVRYGISYPVALDNDMSTWRGYGNHEWPHVYLIDRSGRIRFDLAGEGGDAEIEQQVRALLQPVARTLPSPVSPTVELPDAGSTREIYLGADRGQLEGSIGNEEGFHPGTVVRYAPVSVDRIRLAGTGGVAFLEGAWRNEPEYVEAAEPNARVRLSFRARDVFIVAAAGSGSARVSVTVDGAAVAPSVRGGDLTPEGIVVDRYDLFRVVHLPTTQAHVVTLESGPGFRLYTFTFG